MAFASPLEEGRAGLPYLWPCLESHAPLDAVVIFLGTNDLHDRHGLSGEVAARAIARLARIVVRAPEIGVAGAAPRVLIVAPPPFGRVEPGEGFDGVAPKREQLARHLREQAAELGCGFLDLGEAVAAYSDLDGIHFDRADQPAVARAVEAALRAL
jgi:lysophospholipase L1-like esterase